VILLPVKETEPPDGCFRVSIVGSLVCPEVANQGHQPSGGLWPDLHTREFTTSTRPLGYPSAFRSVAAAIQPIRNLSRSYRKLAPPASRACVTAADPDNQPRCRVDVIAAVVPVLANRDAHTVVHMRTRERSRAFAIAPQSLPHPSTKRSPARSSRDATEVTSATRLLTKSLQRRTGRAFRCTTGGVVDSDGM